MSMAMLATACGTGSTSDDIFAITKEGLGPIKFGMNVSDLPERVEGLYDKIEKVHVPADEWMDSEAYDYYAFKLNDKQVISIDAENIERLFITHPKAHYKGIHVEMLLADVLQTDAVLYASGNIESGEFSSWFEIDGLQLSFNHYGGKGFSKSGMSKLYQSIDDGLRELDFTAEDFQSSAVIDQIYIYGGCK